MKRLLALILVFSMIFCISACKPEEEDNTDIVIKKENETLKIHCYSFTDLNPLLAVKDANMQMLRLMFESLIQCDNTQKPQPQLAESYSVSGDALVWTLKLKKGIKWHDGTEFTAKDVVYSYNYVIDNVDSTAYAVNVSNIESVNATSDYEVNFRLKVPQANFVNLLEIPIVKAESGGPFEPVGTGPYVYKETANKIVYLEANPHWHGGDVSTKNIHVKILPDEETVTYAYVSKEIDVVSVNSGIDMGEYSSNSDNKIVDYPSNNFNYISVNTSAEPLSNRMFRKAIAHAIDKEAINSEVLLSHGSVANSCMNSGWWVYNPGITIYEYSKEKAIEVLDNVKKNMKLVPVRLMVNEDNEEKCKVAEMIKSNLEDCGITLNIEYVDWATFSERAYTGNYQMFLGSIKYSADINPAYLVQNPSAELQSLFSEMDVQTTEDGIKGKYFEIQAKMATELGIIPLYFDASTVMYNKRIEGVLTPCRINIFNGIQGLDLEA